MDDRSCDLNSFYNEKDNFLDRLTTAQTVTYCMAQACYCSGYKHEIIKVKVLE